MKPESTSSIFSKTCATPIPARSRRRSSPKSWPTAWTPARRAGDPELGRLVDNTIWIDDAHPAYARAAGSRSLGYHTALAVALALAPLAVEASQEHGFVTQFLAQWGGASTGPRSPRSRQSKSHG